MKYFTIYSLEIIIQYNKMNREYSKTNKEESMFEAKLDPLKYSIFRVDGQCFSKLIKKNKCFKKPFDEMFAQAMVNTAIHCLKAFCFKWAYVGSDEISFCYNKFSEEDILLEKCLPFNGRILKLNSLLASRVSVCFGKEISKHYTLQTRDFTCFDSRCWQVDSLDQVEKYIQTRRSSIYCNTVSKIANHYFLPNILHKINIAEQLKMLSNVGVRFTTQKTEVEKEDTTNFSEDEKDVLVISEPIFNGTLCLHENREVKMSSRSLIKL